MGFEVSSDRIVCPRCGSIYYKMQGNFFPSQASSYRMTGYIPICKQCVEKIYLAYLSQAVDERKAVRQMCRKFDLFWSDTIFDSIGRRPSTRTAFAQYLQKINTVTHVNKCYDNTLENEGMLWPKDEPVEEVKPEPVKEEVAEPAPPIVSLDDIPESVKMYWGPGYDAEMYQALEQRKNYWVHRLPKDVEIDVGTEALIRQICSLELDINKGRAAGSDVTKSITTLNSLLGSAKLTPSQRKSDDIDPDTLNQPLGVWIMKYENERPLPEIDDDMKDVNGVLKYVFTWLGHVCKMLGKKNGYERYYNHVIEKYRVERPEFSDEDDEEMMMDIIDSEVGDDDWDSGDV